MDPFSELGDRTAWGDVVSRSLHPSVEVGDTPLAVVIAEGLAAATPPWVESGEGRAVAGGWVPLLVSASYEASRVRVPSGGVLAMPADEADEADVTLHAVAVVDGVLVDGAGQRFAPGAPGVLRPVAGRRSLRAVGGPVTAVVVAWRGAPAECTAA